MQTLSSREEMLAKERMLPLIIRMSIPTVVAQLINLLYTIVDRIYIGHIPEIGSEALAGIGLTGSIITLISAFSNFVGGGGTPLAAIALGKGDREEAETILGNGFSMLLFFSLSSVLITSIVKEPLLYAIGASDLTFPYADQYLTIYLTGTLFVQIAVGLTPFITCQGRAGYAMFSVLIGAGLNILLDPLFIFVFDLGVAGAAYATILSQACSAAVVLSFLFSKKATLPLRLPRMKPKKHAIGAILRLGVSPFVMGSTESFVGFVLNGNLQTYGGDLYVSALTVMQSAMQMVGVPLSGFMQGVSPIISYNYGANNKKRVKEAFYIALTFMTLTNFLLFMIIILFPETIAAVFTDNTDLIALVGSIMPMFLTGMTIFGLQRTCQSTFVALGQSGISLFIALLRKVILLIPLAVLLPKIASFGVMGVYLAEPLADAAAAITCTVIFFARFNRILNRNDPKP